MRKARLSIDYVKMIHSKAFVVRDGVYAPENLDQLKQSFQQVLSGAHAFGIPALHEGGTLEEAETLFARYIKPYPVTILENAALRVAVVPELHGRIVSIIDKPTNTEVVRHPDPGERTYPDVSGAALYAMADYIQAKTYEADWKLETRPGPLEVHLVGTCADGLKMRRTIRLAADQPIVYTESGLENTGSSPLDAVLERAV